MDYKSNEDKPTNLIISSYNEADDNSSRLKLLSMIAKNFTKTEIQQKIQQPCSKPHPLRKIISPG